MVKIGKKWLCPICGRTHDLSSKTGKSHYKRYKKSEKLVAKMSKMGMESTQPRKELRKKRVYRKFERITNPKRK